MSRVQGGDDRLVGSIERHHRTGADQLGQALVGHHHGQAIEPVRSRHSRRRGPCRAAAPACRPSPCRRSHRRNGRGHGPTAHRTSRARDRAGASGVLPPVSKISTTDRNGALSATGSTVITNLFVSAGEMRETRQSRARRKSGCVHVPDRATSGPVRQASGVAKGGVRWHAPCILFHQLDGGGPMTSAKRQLRFGAFFSVPGCHPTGWRHPDAICETDLDFRLLADMARTAERGLLDCMFFQDSVAIPGSTAVYGAKPFRVKNGRQAHIEPMSAIAALGAITKHIGLVSTCTTSYNEPYNVARRFLTIDHISGGRAGWNLVTSQAEDEAVNFGRDQHFEHGIRYDRAAEFHDVVIGLWDSWEDDAFLRDKQSGVWFDYDKMHILRHKGKHFTVRGPLERRALAAGPAGGGAGGLVRRRHGARRPHRRHGVHGADHDQGRPGLLQRHALAHGEVRPRARGHPHLPGHHADRRPHRGRGAGEVRGAALDGRRRRRHRRRGAAGGRRRHLRLRSRRARCPSSSPAMRHGRARK